MRNLAFLDVYRHLGLTSPPSVADSIGGGELANFLRDCTPTPVWAELHITPSTLSFPERCKFKLNINKNSENSCIFVLTRGQDKTLCFLVFLNVSAAESQRNTGTSMGISGSSRNHCEQQLVALFTPALQHQGSNGKPWEPCRTVGMNG